MKRLQILVPPIEEQREIAAFLDAKTAAIDSLVAKKKSARCGTGTLEKIADIRVRDGQKGGRGGVIEVNLFRDDGKLVESFSLDVNINLQKILRGVQQRLRHERVGLCFVSRLQTSRHKFSRLLLQARIDAESTCDSSICTE